MVACAHSIFRVSVNIELQSIKLTSTENVVQLYRFTSFILGFFRISKCTTSTLPHLLTVLECLCTSGPIKTSPVQRISVFCVSDQVRHKPTCSATEVNEARNSGSIN